MGKERPVFKRMIKDIGGGKVLEPLIMNALYDPQYPEFTVKMRGGKRGTRKPDGWFHPSTHPLWDERQLYYYLAEPENVIAEPLDPLGIMATTAGTFWHEFVQHVLVDAGILLDTEVKVEDKECGSRGSMDGILTSEAWEFKTMNGQKLRNIVDGSPNDPAVLASFKKKCPDYWAQAQEYMRMSGYRIMRLTILETGYPFTMREIAIPYDPLEALAVRDKYMSVRQAVADQRLPRACCAPGSAKSRSCFARGVCPVGQMV